MKDTSIEVYRENGYTELSMIVQIPFFNKQKGQDFDIDRAQKRADAYLFDLIGSFAPRMIASLERRMHACQENLIKHLDSVEYSDECGHIVYRRRDGSCGNFNVFSFKLMQEAVKTLRQSNWRGFKDNIWYVDQTLKALLNDTEIDRSDHGQLKYSDLVSFLCEVHLNGYHNHDVD